MILQCVHRDLALRNVFVKRNKMIRIGDFGLARHHSKKSYYRFFYILLNSSSLKFSECNAILIHHYLFFGLHLNVSMNQSSLKWLMFGLMVFVFLNFFHLENHLIKNFTIHRLTMWCIIWRKGTDSQPQDIAMQKCELKR